MEVKMQKYNWVWACNACGEMKMQEDNAGVGMLGYINMCLGI